MSFFGFDTSLPPRGKEDEIGDKTIDPFDPTANADDDAAFEEKLRGLRTAGQEDVEIYTWGGGGDEGNDGLGNLLEETGDDLNDDTFGVGEVGRDFDFGNTDPIKQSSNIFESATAPMPISNKKNDAAFASTMDDFWAMPDLPSEPRQMGQESGNKQPPSRQPQTLEEIESQLRKSQGVQQAEALAPQRRVLTIEEVEAEMLSKRHQHDQSLSTFPPLGTIADMQQQKPPAQVPGIPPSSDDQSPTAVVARMQSLLRALPNPIQARILALPPYMQFGATESVSRDFPALLVAANPEVLPQQVENPVQWPRIDGGPEQQNRIGYLVDAAMSKIDLAHRYEAKHQLRLAKIRSMSQRNNIMTRGDKDFITRIQVSQLITNDPYTDDFYAHIYFALHGNKMQPVLSSSEKEKDGNDEQPVQRKGRQRKQQPSRRESAMLRMQQQMERIVQGRKERIEKSSANTALEGALGRVSLSSSKAPRQMLQINQESDIQTGDSDGAGHAQDAVQQALKGASLAQGAAGQKRPALSKFEVLSILETLYDTVLALEQSRRTAPADVSEQNEDPVAVEWRDSRDDLLTKLWAELRVLEPLEVSDPHPFISLMSTVKGKRLLPRVLRHLSNEQALTAMTMIVASFDRIDVVRESALIDETPSARSAAITERRQELLRQTEAFVISIVPAMFNLIATVPMRIVSGMLALFIERNDLIRVVQSKVSVLMYYFSRS